MKKDQAEANAHVADVAMMPSDTAAPFLKTAKAPSKLLSFFKFCRMLLKTNK